ncbi:MAG TPA: TRAM domain-containing protein [Actinomycetes bacterium]|nr:TRAM domain-containing protein [Actinomycetes bacterium]
MSAGEQVRHAGEQSPAPGDLEEVTCHGVAHGGEAVGRLADGRAVFIAGAIPGERVRVRVVDERKRFARAELVEVLQASPDRITPPCPHFGPGRCGGCTWQHLRPAAQAALKARLVREQLAHVGGLHEVEVREPLRPQAPGQPQGFGYRQRATLTAGPDGRLGFLKSGSHEVHPVDRCPLLAASLQELPARLGRQPAGSRVRLRAGARGERLVVLEAGAAARVPPAEDADGALAWASVQANGKVRDGRGVPFVNEKVAGARFHVGAASFFQVHREGAEALVRLVDRALRPRTRDVLVDVYAGVGLFAATVGAGVRSVIAIESWKPAAKDAERNLRRHPRARVLKEDALRSLRGLNAADVMVLDPPRSGAGRDVIRQVARLAPRAVALVSCDPAALARDLRAFVDEGFDVAWVQPVDLFPQTAHVETVTALRRRRSDG